MIKHAYFKGLYLIVLDRRTLETVHIGKYNTIQTRDHDTVLGTSVYWYHQDYIINEDGNFVESGNPVEDPDIVYNKTDNFYNSNQMAKKIREYDSNYFIVVVSNYAWESYFSEDLGRTLENCGAFLVKEFTHQAAARFGNFSRIYDFRST